MHTEYHRWYSPNLGHDIEVKEYGHWGQPILSFPCAGGSCHEMGDFGMIEAIRWFIDSGKTKVFAVSSIDHQSWLNEGASAEDRARRHEDYDRAIIHEVVPFIHGRQGQAQGIIATGCSLGAYHAVNFALRHPDVFWATVALSGVYSVKHMVGDYLGPTAYLNSPVDYLPNLNDGWYLERLRNNRLIVCCGQGAWEEPGLSDTRRLQYLLGDKGIGHWVDIWGHDVNHDWPWWLKQMPHFLGHLV